MIKAMGYICDYNSYINENNLEIERLTKLLDTVRSNRDFDRVSFEIERLVNKYKYPRTDYSFHSWFGKSVLKDSRGNPMVLYHRNKSNKKIEEFKFNTKDLYSSGNIKGIYFFDRNDHVQYGGTVYACYVKLENPYYMFSSIPEVKYMRSDLIKLVRAHYSSLILTDDYIDTEILNPMFGGTIKKDIDNTLKRKLLIAMGYDGVINGSVNNGKIDFGREVSSSHANEVIVLHANHIKAISNKGGWSIGSNNIYGFCTHTRYYTHIRYIKRNNYMYGCSFFCISVRLILEYSFITKKCLK